MNQQTLLANFLINDAKRGSNSNRGSGIEQAQANGLRKSGIGRNSLKNTQPIAIQHPTRKSKFQRSTTNEQSNTIGFSNKMSIVNMVTNLEVENKSKVDSQDSPSRGDYSEVDNEFLEDDECNLKEVKKSFDFKGPSVIKEQNEEEDEKINEKKTKNKLTIKSPSNNDSKRNSRSWL